MPKTVIEFTPDEGRVSFKKRKRMAGTKSKMQKEIKQVNTASNQGASYSAYTVRPGLSSPDSQDGSIYIHPWRFTRLVYPSVGTSNDTRIGNSFFLRALRIKGYVTYSSRNILRPIHWRLKLYRFEGASPYNFVAGSTAIDQVAQYSTLFANWENPTDWTSGSQVIAACRHNFWKAIKKYPKHYDYTCKTIASGVIPKSNSFIATGSASYGSQTTYSVGAQVETNNSDSGDFPLDVIVKLHDRIVIKDNVPSASYFFVFEDDFGMFIKVVEGTQTSFPTWSLSNEVTYKVYSLEFWSRFYFSDD